MTSLIELQTFYNHIDPSLAPVKSEIGHFNILKIEDILQPQNKKLNYSKRDFFKVSLITGHNKLHYADQSIEILESALVFTNPMIPYSWEIMDEKQTGFVCIFTEAFFSRFGNIREYPVFQFSGAAIIPLKAEEAEKYSDLFSRMVKELQSDYVYKYDLLRNLLMEIVHTAQQMQPASGSLAHGANAAERITSLFLELLERQFPIELSNQVMQLRSPADFATSLHIHVNHLNKALKEITGKTTTQHINERLLQEARILLKSTTWTITEIAWSLGFEEPNHFSGFFKSKSGETPKNYRQSAID